MKYDLGGREAPYIFEGRIGNGQIIELCSKDNGIME
jgi:hypothetical protein